ncbi:MAG: hypothetical protein DRJ47_09880, partial [Thermoprotei archaeon]
EVILGIRPEDITINKVPTEGQINIRSEVYVIEPLGSETIVDFKTGDKNLKAKTIQEAVNPGDKIYHTKFKWIFNTMLLKYTFDKNKNRMYYSRSMYSLNSAGWG